ncbi:sigma 54-interacting transcriptional regulator [Nannocystis punicea]|uniref:Sigma 54-interacting transcriptional regulator n=1 Tax=Nannocystis punicea TaxID=2995304 RepID=A0ABY7GTH4_9BACT|nr:sigma 54-interacting transcriptional regulator [Nannocystis poenicansa]WAS90266.1 sigma 54-interacting transcriptional regulator [Nannocystis poenicansa]
MSTPREKPLEPTAAVPQFSRTYQRLGRVNLRVLEGPDRGKEFHVDLSDRRLITAGRDEVNDIVLTDTHVSGNHFQIAVTPRGLLLRDLDSTNGVHVGDVRVREVWLTAQTVFRAGQSTFRLLGTDDVQIALPLIDRFDELYGRSAAMRELFSTLERLATRGDRLRVLIGGETGTGKELVARALHHRSSRRAGPFIVQDCTAIPRELAEAVLFGHSKGAFTGAVGDRPGSFEEADGGTIFLDEIGELPLDLQSKLLRVIQEGEVVRVGERSPRKVDVRVLCATHRDLRAMVAEARFRQDLFFRIADVRVEVPSLREREDDVLLLAELFLRRCAGAGEPRTLSQSARAALQAHTWPGNVRELKSVIERAHVMADGPEITADDLSLAPEASARRVVVHDGLLLLPHDRAVDEFERLYFTSLLAQHPTKAKAARAAEMSGEGLRQALKRLQIRG